MQNNWMNADVGTMLKTLGENIRNFGGFSPEEVKLSGLVSEEALSYAILDALKDGDKTGHEIALYIQGLHPAKKLSAGSIYPLLESLQDKVHIKVNVKKDRKVYSLTSEGKAELKSRPEEPLAEAESTQNSWTPKWVDLRGAVAVSSARLAKVSLEVSQYGTKEQQDAAAAAIDDARKRIHEILSEK
jgi:DNA-binding PadR family transcriptional regulator